MPLNLSINDGEITPYLKYNAKAGRFYVRADGSQQDYEVVNPRLVFDMANIKTGWIFYQEGVGPEKVWDPSPSQIAARPAGPRKFKRGFEVMVFGNDQLPGFGPLGLREFSSTATNVISSMLAMYAEYEAGMSANPQAAPFYVCTGVKPIQGTYGTNYEPQFALKGWVPRSKIPAFDARDHDQPASVPAGAMAYAEASGGFAPSSAPNGSFAPNARQRQQAPMPAPDNYGAQLDDEIPF